MTLEQEIIKLEKSYARFYNRYSVIANEPVFNDNPMKEELLELISDFLHHTSLLIRARREELATSRSE
jgi:hypothetical protein